MADTPPASDTTTTSQTAAQTAPKADTPTLTKPAASPSSKSSNPRYAAMGKMPNAPVKRRKRSNSALLTFSAFVLTMLWFGTVGFYVIKAGGFTPFLESSGAAAIVAVTGLMMAPAALFWMVFAYIKRAYDVEAAMEPLMRQLALVTGTGGIAETRIRRFNDAISEQLSLLRSTGDTATKTAESALGILKSEREELSQSQLSFSKDIAGLVSTMREQTGQLDKLVNESQAHLATVADKSSTISQTLASESQSAETRLKSLLETVTNQFGTYFNKLDSEQQVHLNNYAALSHNLSQTLSSDATDIEKRLNELLSGISTTLNEVERVTGERLIDIESTISNISEREKALKSEAAVVSASVEDSASAMAEATARFKEAASMGREETDRLIATLNEQTRTMDSRADHMRDRVNETRTLIADMAEQLAAAATTLQSTSEVSTANAAKQTDVLTSAAAALDETAQKIVSQLDEHVATYGDKQKYISGLYADVLDGLSRETKSLVSTAEQLALRADVSQDKIQYAMGELSRTTGESFDRYTAISEKAEAQASVVAENFNGAIDKYAATARQLNNAAAELQQLATRCEEAITTMDETLTDRASMLDKVSERMDNASRNIKDDAAGLVTTLQQLADRLETVRTAATQTSDQTVMRLTDIANVAGRNLTGIENLAAATIGKLSGASEEIERQKTLIAGQVENIQASLEGVGDGLANRLSGVLSQVERSSQTAVELVEGFLTRAGALAPMLKEEAAKATAIAAETASTMGDYAVAYGDKIAGEKLRWQDMVEEQAKAFAATHGDLQTQIKMLQEVHADLGRASQSATERLMAHNTSVVDLETRIVQSGTTQQAQLNNVRDEIEKIVDYLQRQALALGTVTQGALEGVRTATEQFGIEARSLGELSRQTESHIAAATSRMVEARETITETRENVYAMRTEIEQTLDKLSTQTGLLADAGSTSREAGDSVINGAREATSQLSTLIDTLQQAVDGTATARTSVYVQLDDVSARLSDETGKLRDYLDSISSKVNEAAESIGTAGQGVTQRLVSQLEGDISTLRSRLSTVTEDIGAMLTGALDGASNAATQFKAHMQAELGEIESFADTTTSKVALAATSLGNVGRDVSEQLGRALEQISATDATLIQLGEHAGGMRRQMIEESEAMISTLDRISQQLTSQLGIMRSAGESSIGSARAESEALQETISALLASLGNSTSKLQDVSQTAGTYLAGFGSQLTNQIDIVKEAGTELQALCENAATSESKIENTLAGLMMQVTRARGDMAALDLQIGDQTSRLTQQQQDALATLSQTLATLEQVSNRIVGTSRDALIAANDVHSRYSEISTFADDVVGARTNAFVEAANAGHEALSRYADSVASNTGVLTEGHTQLGYMMGNLRDEATKLEDRLTSLADRVTAAGASSSAGAQQVMQRLGDIVDMLSTQMGRVVETAESTASNIRMQSESLRSEGDSLRQSGTDFANAALDMAASAGESLGSFSESTKAARDNFASEIAITLDTLIKAQSSYEEMTGELSRQQDETRNFISTIAGNFGVLLQTTQTTMQQLKQELETTAMAASSTLDQSSISMVAQGDSFAKLGERLATVVEQIGFETSNVLGDLKHVTERLETVQSRTTELASQTEQRLTDAANALEGRQSALGAVADTAAERMYAVGRGITAQTAAIEAASTTLAQSSISAESALRQLSQTMSISASEIDEAAVKYRDAQGDLVTSSDSAMQNAARMMEQFTFIKAQLANQANEMTGVIETMSQSADTNVRQLADDMRMLVERVSAADDVLSGRMTSFAAGQTNLRHEIGLTVESVEEAANRMSQAGQSAVLQSAALEQQVRNVEGRADAIAEAVATLESAGDALTRTSSETEKTIRDFGKTMASSLGEFEDIAEQYRTGQQELGATARMVLADTARIMAEFNSFRTQLSHQVTELSSHMDTMSASTDNRIRQIASDLRGVVEDISEADKILSGRVDSMSQNHTQLRSEIDKSMQTMAAASNRVQQVASDATSDLDNVTDRLSTLRSVTGVTVTAEVAELRSLVDSATSLMNDLGKQLEAQVGAVTDAGSSLAHVSGSVNDNTAAALSRLQTLNQHLEAAKQAATLATEQAARRVADILAQVDSEDDVQQVG